MVYAQTAVKFSKILLTSSRFRTLTKLMEYMHDEGVDTKALWKHLQQLVIKTIISSEALITPLCEENMNSYYNCYELFGIDVLLDEHLKPWLLEVSLLCFHYSKCLFTIVV